jgi:cobalt-precorrin-5B (C1)-methyltransferase
MKLKKHHRHLRTGFTTGTAAAAAAKAAVMTICRQTAPATVTVGLLTGDTLQIAVHEGKVTDQSTAVCTVVKDAGDDPDVTHKAIIGARVTLNDNCRDLVISGGQGVGTVTRPGLEVPPGKAAINPGPEKMIRQSVREVLDSFFDTRGAQIEIFVPRGEEIARHTLNGRLGIIGGISILGTTGLVKPMSHEAYIATIASAMSVARACGSDTVVCTTGRRSERFAQTLLAELPETAFVQIGDYFEKSMQLAFQNGFSHVVLAVFFGKAVKMAQGAPHTHASKSRMGLDCLVRWVANRYPDPILAETAAAANTAREAFPLIYNNCPMVLEDMVKRIISVAKKFAGSPMALRIVIFDYDGNVAMDSNNFREASASLR